MTVTRHREILIFCHRHRHRHRWRKKYSPSPSPYTFFEGGSRSEIYLKDDDGDYETKKQTLGGLGGGFSRFLRKNLYAIFCSEYDG